MLGSEVIIVTSLSWGARASDFISIVEKDISKINTTWNSIKQQVVACVGVSIFSCVVHTHDYT